jgi:hypothetical protein
MSNSFASLVARLEQEIKEKDNTLILEQERLLELSKSKAILVNRVENEKDRYDTQVNRANDLELQLKGIVAELEAERTRCQELQSGMGQKSNE